MPRRRRGARAGSSLNRLPQHVLQAHIMSLLANQNLARLAGTSRAFRGASRTSLKDREQGKLAELEGLITAVVGASRLPVHANVGQHILQFLRTRGVATNADVTPVFDDYVRHVIPIRTPHFSGELGFFVTLPDPHEPDDPPTIFNVYFQLGSAAAPAPPKYLVQEDMLRRSGMRITVDRGFPAAWAKILDRGLGLRRSARTPRRRA